MLDKYVGNVVFVKLPNNTKPMRRWIVRLREDGKYIVRAPKFGILLKRLRFHHDSDYNDEHVLPSNATFSDARTKKRTHKKKFRHTKKRH
jgi:hypothetical protein